MDYACSTVVTEPHSRFPNRRPLSATNTAAADRRPPPQTPLKIRAETALEMLNRGLATMIDVRQPFELACGESVDCAENVPLLHLKLALDDDFSAEELEMLADERPNSAEVLGFLQIIDRHSRDGRPVLCFCGSGRRSLHAVRLLRAFRLPHCYSVAGGIRAIRRLRPAAVG